MPKEVQYHLGEQYADALLGPIAASLRELEQRAEHYLKHLEMSSGDEETVRAARRALGMARAEVERLSRESLRVSQV